MEGSEENQKLKEKISSLETRIHRLESDLIHDPLTALKTRAFFREELDMYLLSIGNARSEKRLEWFGFRNICVLFFDIDNFKKVNDTYGHPAGDKVLAEVSRTIAVDVREGDTVARWGGEEIVATLLGANESDGKGKAEKIRIKISELSFAQYPDLKVTVSIGVSHSEDNLRSEELISRADKALYRAKETGKNKVVAYSEV